MILSSKVLGATGLSCLCRSSLWLHTPVLRPYPILKNKMNIFCHMYSMLPFPLLDKYWVYSYCSNYYRAKWIVFNHSKYLSKFCFWFVGVPLLCQKKPLISTLPILSQLKVCLTELSEETLEWPQRTSTPSTGCLLLLLSCGWWTSLSLVYGFTLLPNYVRNRSSFIGR
jgi:hypothetical protein